MAARTPDLLERAGSVPVPDGKRGVAWKDVREAAWRQATAHHR